MQEIIRIVDVFPAPFGPRNPNDSPRAMSKSTPSTATNSPNRFTRPRAVTIGWSVRVDDAPGGAEDGGIDGGGGVTDGGVTGPT